MIFFILGILHATAQQKLNFRLFENFDRNRDGILTHSQFIEGLNRAFIAEVMLIKRIEVDKANTNNFGREFLGEKESDGRVYLSNIEEWIDSGELVRAYREWKIINDEDEEHLDPNHVHGQNKRPRFRKAPAMKQRKDL